MATPQIAVSDPPLERATQRNFPVQPGRSHRAHLALPAVGQLRQGIDALLAHFSITIAGQHQGHIQLLDQLRAAMIVELAHRALAHPRRLCWHRFLQRGEQPGAQRLAGKQHAFLAPTRRGPNQTHLFGSKPPTLQHQMRHRQRLRILGHRPVSQRNGHPGRKPQSLHAHHQAIRILRLLRHPGHRVRRNAHRRVTQCGICPVPIIPTHQHVHIHGQRPLRQHRILNQPRPRRHRFQGVLHLIWPALDLHVRGPQLIAPPRLFRQPIQHFLLLHPAGDPMAGMLHRLCQILRGAHSVRHV